MQSESSYKDEFVHLQAPIKIYYKNPILDCIVLFIVACLQIVCKILFSPNPFH